MTEFEEKLTAAGFKPDDIECVVDIVRDHQADLVMQQTAELVRLVFLRVGSDSPAGLALRRALGFSSDVSLARAAKAFLVSKQYLHDLQADLEAQLGPLSLGAAARPTDPAPGRAGPPGGKPLHR